MGIIDDEGTVRLESTGAATSLIVGEGDFATVDLAGGGVVSMSDSWANTIVGSGIGDILINDGDTISGAGLITRINVVNKGLIESAGSYGLTILGVQLDNSQGTVLAATGNVYLNATRISGGTLSAAADEAIVSIGGGGAHPVLDDGVAGDDHAGNHGGGRQRRRARTGGDRLGAGLDRKSGNDRARSLRALGPT